MVTRLLEILNTARETSRSITMVVNGWDGIFTNICRPLQAIL
jgi:hypothetical protein